MHILEIQQTSFCLTFIGIRFPNWWFLGKQCLLMPYYILDCERGFSHQKISCRFCLKEKCLNILKIKCESGLMLTTTSGTLRCCGKTEDVTYTIGWQRTFQVRFCLCIDAIDGKFVHISTNDTGAKINWFSKFGYFDQIKIIYQQRRKHMINLKFLVIY